MLEITRYTTTALRKAAVWSLTDAGTVVYDSENGRYYMITSAGTGAGTMIAFAEQYGVVAFPLDEWREADTSGDVGNIVAIGGVLASDSTPILRGDANETQEIVWAASNNDLILQQRPVPEDFDGTRDCTMMLRTASGGATDAASFSVLSGWDNAAQVTDTATGAASATEGAANATIAAADVPDAPLKVTIQLVPTAHTTDTKILRNSYLRYFRK